MLLSYYTSCSHNTFGLLSNRLLRSLFFPQWLHISSLDGRKRPRLLIRSGKVVLITNYMRKEYSPQCTLPWEYWPLFHLWTWFSNLSVLESLHLLPRIQPRLRRRIVVVLALSRAPQMFPEHHISRAPLVNRNLIHISSH